MKRVIAAVMVAAAVAMVAPMQAQAPKALASGIDTAGFDRTVRPQGDFYTSFMNEARIEALGSTPLAEPFRAIDAVTTRAGLARVFARLSKTDINTPMASLVEPDFKDPKINAFFLYQGGIDSPEWMSPATKAEQFRGNGPLGNVPEFYTMFDVKPGDRLYIDPAKRVKFWQGLTAPSEPGSLNRSYIRSRAAQAAE